MLTSPLLAYRVSGGTSLSPTTAPTRGTVMLTVNGRVVVASHRGYPGFRRSGEPVLMGIGGCLHTRVDAQLGIDVGYVTCRRRWTDKEQIAQLAVAVAGGEQAQHFQLTRGQAV